MDTKVLHIRLDVDRYEALRKLGEACRLNTTALGVILLESAIQAIARNQDRVPLPLQFEVKEALPPRSEPRPVKLPARR